MGKVQRSRVDNNGISSRTYQTDAVTQIYYNTPSSEAHTDTRNIYKVNTTILYGKQECVKRYGALNAGELETSIHG